MPAALVLAACAAAAVLGAVSSPEPVRAESGSKAGPEAGPRLQDIERQRRELRTRGDALKREAERLARETEETQRQLVEVAAQARAGERAIAEQEARLTEIRAEEAERTRNLEARRARLAELLAALERVARHPPEALLAYTHTPQDALRGAMLLGAVIPKLEAQARALKDSLEALARLREQGTARAEALTRERAALEEKRAALDALFEKKKGLAQSARSELQAAEARMTQLAREARDLRELLEGIERERRAQAARAAKARAEAARKLAEAERAARAAVNRAPPPQPAPRPPAVQPQDRQQARLMTPFRPPDLPSSIVKARGKLVRPVVGRVALGFGEDDGPAGTAKGATFETAGGAQVLAPFGGEAVFAGPFRGYGLLLIIDHGEGYHTLLAGLGRIDAAVGQRLLAGEPVGAMARTAPDSPRLYMELRHASRPIDPLPWLAAPPGTNANSKVSG